jgi:rhomboid family GlyGly-CTERM serine protease
MTAYKQLLKYMRHITQYTNIHFFFVSLILLFSFQFIQIFVTDLSFYRTAISNYEIWRLLSGGLVHSNTLHLSLNLAGLFFLLTLYDLQIKVITWCYMSICLVLSINIIIYFFLPSTDLYVGFSGALHGLFVWYSIAEWRRKPSWFPSLVMCLLIGKLILDILIKESMSSQLIGMRVHWQAHWIGVLLGAIFSFWPKNKTA